MENRKQSVRLLMQKERERREQLRRQAAALAATSVQQQQQRQQETDGGPSSVPREEEALKTKAPSPPLSPSQPLAEAASSAATGSCASVKQELPPDFFDAPGCTPHETAVPEPQSDVEVGVTSNAAAGAAEVAAAAQHVAAGAVKSPAAASEAEAEPEAVTDEEEEEGVVFEIEEPDSSLLLPRHAQGSSDLADVLPVRDGEEATGECRDTRPETAGAPPEPPTVQFASRPAAAPAAVSEETAETARQAAAASGGGRREQAPPREETVSAPCVPAAAAAPAVTPSPVTAALLASATGDELRWYRPFDTVFHSELLHEEEELAELQREAQVAAEKRAAAAREAASAAAAAAVAAAAAAAGDKGASKKDEAAAVSGLTKHQLAKRRAAAEATAAAAAAAEAAATAAAAAAEKRAAASEALLGKAGAARAARVLAQQRENTAQDVAVPWGFFDDEEREAAARGLTGPKRLQELLQRAEERRRDMAQDLQERKADFLRHREDVRRFVHGVEEQLQDNSAYRLRVERLKQKRKAAAAGLECSSSGEMAAPTAAPSTTVPAGEAAAAAGEAKASQGAALTVEADTCRTAAAREAGGPAEAAGTAVKQDLKKGPKVKKEDPGSISADIRGPRCGDSYSRHDDTDNRVEPTRTSGRLETAKPRVKSVSPDGDVGLKALTKNELLTGQLATVTPAVGMQLLQTKQERLQQGTVEQPGSVQANTSPREDYDSGSPDEEADDVCTGEEDDDSGWRAKSLLTHSPVSDV